MQQPLGLRHRVRRVRQQLDTLQVRRPLLFLQQEQVGRFFRHPAVDQLIERIRERVGVDREPLADEWVQVVIEAELSDG